MSSGPVPGRHNALTDIEGLEVGQLTRDDPPYLSGVTVVLAARLGAVGAVDVRGAAPATRETDALQPENLVDAVHAVVLSGSSAYGLAAADGVMRYCEEQGIGRRVGAGAGEVVPIVAAASLFDLRRGGQFSARVGAVEGYEAAAAARSGPVEQGNAGAGTGALLAGLTMKGGVGTASALSPVGTVAALVAVNAVGSAVDPLSGQLWSAGSALAGELGRLGTASEADLAAYRQAAAAARRPPAAASPSGEDQGSGGGNTVIGVVATDVALTKLEAQRLARVAHDGLARAVRPSHTMFDGDVLFALATGRRPPAGELASAELAPEHGTARALALVELYELGADCIARAVAHAVLAARSVGGFRSYREAFPSVFSDNDR